MILRHTTPTVNVPSIEKRGIDPRFSTGKIVAVWLHSPEQTRWAEGHVRKRHDLGNGGVSLTTLEVDVPRSWLRRRQKGLWTCERVIPAPRIIGLVTQEAIGPEEICQHKERFANCLCTLPASERTLWSARELAGEFYEILEAEEQRADPDNTEEISADLSTAEDMDLLIETLHHQVAAFRFHLGELMMNPHQLLAYLRFRDELKKERGWG